MSEDEPPKPPIPLDYQSPMDRPRSPVPVFIIGGVLGLITGFIFLLLAGWAIVTGLTVQGPPTPIAFFDFAVLLALVITMIRLSNPQSRRTRPFLLGYLAGVCLAALVQGICFAALR